MTDHKTKVVEEPVGYDHPPTERIPVQGELSEDRVAADRPFAESEEDRVESDHDRLEAEHDGLESDHDRLEPDRDGREPGYDDVESGRDGLEPGHDNVESDRDGLEPGYDNVESERDGLASDRDDRQADVESFAPEADRAELDQDRPESLTTPENAETAEPATAAAAPDSTEAFFDESAMGGFRDRWRELQGGFVDDPEQAVRGAGELVDEIMRELAERKAGLDERWRAGDAGTEELRVVIREYRAFFNRLLTD